jgi:hypothetical protein
MMMLSHLADSVLRSQRIDLAACLAASVARPDHDPP